VKRPPAGFWVMFVVVQAIGYLLPHFAHPRLDVDSYLVGGVLLLPGSLAALLVDAASGGEITLALCALISAADLAAWYAAWRMIAARRPSST
jgi:hypothetical protein